MAYFFSLLSAKLSARAKEVVTVFTMQKFCCRNQKKNLNISEEMKEDEKRVRERGVGGGETWRIEN